MNINEGITQLLRNVYEGEQVSCPYIVQKEGKLQLAMFSYIAVGEAPMRIYGYDRELFYDGEGVFEEARSYFATEEEAITVSKTPTTTWEQWQNMYYAYYEALQQYVDAPSPETVAELKARFWALIPPEAAELYRRICPSFVALVS